MSAVELAQGYVSLIPSMDGTKASLAKQLMPAATSAGNTAGLAGGAAMGGSMRGAFMKYLGPAALAAGVVVAFKGLYEIGDTWNDITNEIRVGTGAQGEALDGLVDSVKNIGRQVPAELDTIGTTVADLNTRLGLSGETLETVASQYLEAGRILGSDVDINATSAAFSAFQIEGEGVIDGMDHLFRVSQATGVGINELATGAVNAAPMVKQLGWSFEETTAFVGVFDKAGLNANKMMGPLGRSLATMAKEGEAPAEVFPRVIEQLEGLVKAGDDAAAMNLASEMFGTRGAAQFLNAVESGTLALDDLVGAAGITSDTILGLGEETLTSAERWQILKNSASAALEPLGSSVFQGLQGALEAVMPYLTSFAEWLGDNTWAIAAFAGVVGGTLLAAFISWTAAVWANTVAMLASPITWIVLGIVALVAGIVLLVQNWDVVTEAFAAGWEWIKDAFSTGWEAVKGFLSQLWDFIKQVWEWSPIGMIVSNWDKITGFFTDFGEKVKGFFRSVWDFLKSVWKWTPIGMITSNWGKIMDFFKEIPGKIGKFFSKVKDFITKPFKAAFNAVAGFWNNSVGKLSFSAPSWVPGIGGKGFSLPKIPMLASGGIVDRATLAMVGEGRHPEIVAPLPDYLDMVHDAANLGGGGINISVAEMNVRDESDIRKVAQELKRLFDRDSRAVAY